MTGAAMSRSSHGELRAGGICGFLSGIFFLSTFLVAYNFPATASEADATLAGFSGLQNSFLAGAVLIGLAAVFAIPFYSSVGNAFEGEQALSVRSATIFSVIGIAVTALTFIGEVIALWSLKDAYAQPGQSRTAAVVVAQVVITFGSITVGVIFLAVGIGAFGFAMVRTSRFPRWLGYVGIVGGVLLAAGFIPVPGAFAIFFVSFAFLLVWVFGTAAVLWRSAASQGTS
jgi:hypothetical protein